MFLSIQWKILWLSDPRTPQLRNARMNCLHKLTHFSYAYVPGDGFHLGSITIHFHACPYQPPLPSLSSRVPVTLASQAQSSKTLIRSWPLTPLTLFLHPAPKLLALKSQSCLPALLSKSGSHWRFWHVAVEGKWLWIIALVSAGIELIFLSVAAVFWI